MPPRDDSNVVDLGSRPGFRPDMAALARAQVAAARESLGLTTAEFAAVLTPLLGWEPSPGVIANWESTATPPGDALIAAGIVSRAAPLTPAELDSDDLIHQLVGNRYADVEAVFATRSEFVSAMPPQTLFAGATTIEAAGLSLNLVCQQFADQDLRALIEGGATVRCLFLAPYGTAIAARETEEGYPAGHLSALTEMNRQILLQRVRQRLPADARERLQVGTYDETIRFNIILVDRATAVVQPYLSTARGVESPTFLLRRRPGRHGLFGVFEQTFNWLSEQTTSDG
jgi:Domain of unknown function (DUF5919)